MDKYLQLITECKKQNRSAQKALYELYAPSMLALCMRYCCDNEVAQDLMHDGFIIVFTQIGSYSGAGSFEGWLKRIFVNLALDNYRKEKKKLAFIEEFSYSSELSVEGMEDDILEIGDITRNELMGMIRDLPNGYRTVFNMYIFEEMSHKEIAQSLGITENASRSQLSRAKSILQKKVQTLLEKTKARI